MTVNQPIAPYCSLFASFDAEQFKNKLRQHLLSFQGRDPQRADNRDMYKALAYTLRDALIEKWIQTQKSYYEKKKKRVYYLSLEFLVGRSLGNALINLGFIDEATKVLEQMGYDLEKIREEEVDAGLGNGGLGRLAACFLDSMATLRIPAYGYGIRYEYGLFYQRLMDGNQVESPDNWLRYGTPWEFERPQHLHPVNFYGRVRSYVDEKGRYRAAWVDTDEVMAMACDYMVPGFNNDYVINMRLWTAKASREFDFSFFSRGDYIAAVESKVMSETLSKLLYPTDHVKEGRELRLKQQYFLVAATFQDIFRRYKKEYASLDKFSNRIAVQLNDTHPAIAIPELMRLLVDHERLPWEKAWEICVGTFAYTNHTIMPEALETWPVEMVGRVLPRHLEIIYEINRRFLEEVARRYSGDIEKIRSMSLIEEGPVKKVRMAHLAIVGSHSVNGVARLHTHLLQTRIFKNFHAFFPGRFNSKTNGITQRRWLLKANPGLAGLITETIGGEWVTNLDHLRNLEQYAEDFAFQEKWQQVRLANKMILADIINRDCNLAVDVHSLFDVQVKRIHEYKRQLLNALHVIALYLRIIKGQAEVVPRTVIFAGKAAPSYWKAKLIIKFINSIAEVVNHDRRVKDRLKVAFIPNYGVSLAEKIFPAADLSEQISTAGTEASGTGNMKFALNGALTIGTLDGANIEIAEEIGRENMFIFGLTAEQAEVELAHPKRIPTTIVAENEVVREVIESIRSGMFSRGDKQLFASLVEGVLDRHDPYLVLRDFEEYLDCQQRVADVYRERSLWTGKSILNVARIGKFSSDRTIREYAEEIWGVAVED